MDRARLTIKFNGEIFLQCADGVMAASGQEGERLFVRPYLQRSDEDGIGQTLPLFFFEYCIFQVVPTRVAHDDAAAQETGTRVDGDDCYTHISSRDAALLQREAAGDDASVQVLSAGSTTTSGNTSALLGRNNSSSGNAMIDNDFVSVPGAADTLRAQEITYGRRFSLVHAASQLYVAVSHTQSADNDPDCMRVILVKPEAARSAACEFMFVSRFKIHGDGDRVCRYDEAIIRLASSPVFLHVSGPRRALRPAATPGALQPSLSGNVVLSRSAADGQSPRLAGSLSFAASDRPTVAAAAQPAALPSPAATRESPGAASHVSTSSDDREDETMRDHAYDVLVAEQMNEVNGSEECGVSFVIHRYDIGADRANLERAKLRITRPYISAGIPVALYHSERDAFLTTSLTIPRAPPAIIDSGELFDDRPEVTEDCAEGTQRRWHRLRPRISTMNGTDATTAEDTEGGRGAGIASGSVDAPSPDMPACDKMQVTQPRETPAMYYAASSASSGKNGQEGDGGQLRSHKEDEQEEENRNGEEGGEEIDEEAASQATRGFVYESATQQVPFPVFASAATDSHPAQTDRTLFESIYDCNALWMFETDEPTIGGPVRLSVQQNRLRHLTSGLYLAVCGTAVDSVFAAEGKSDVDDDDSSNSSSDEGGRDEEAASQEPRQASHPITPREKDTLRRRRSRSSSTSKAISATSASAHTPRTADAHDAVPLRRSASAPLLGRGGHGGRARRGGREGGAAAARTHDGARDTIRPTTLCLIPEPHTDKDLQRTLFTVSTLLNTDAHWLIAQDCLVLRNTLTGLYVSTARDSPRQAEVPLALSWQPSTADTVVVSHVPERLKQATYFLRNQSLYLLHYRDAMQAAIRAQHAAQRTAGHSSWQPPELTAAERAVVAARMQHSDVDAELLAEKEAARVETTVCAAAADLPASYRALHHAICLCERALAALIRFCSDSREENVLKRDGLPIREHQRMLYDMQFHKLIFDVLFAPFALLVEKGRSGDDDAGSPSAGGGVGGGGQEKGAAGKAGTHDMETQTCATRRFDLWHHRVDLAHAVHGLPALPFSGGLLRLDALMLPEHRELHLICRLALRLLRQMSSGSPMFVIGWCEYVMHLLAMDGHRLFIVDALRALFEDNPRIPFAIVEKVFAHAIQGIATFHRPALLDFLGVACVRDFCGISARQAYVCRELLMRRPDLLCRFTTVRRGVSSAVKTEEEGEEEFAIVLPDAAATAALPHEPISYIRFVTETTDVKLVRFVENQIALLARLCYNGAPSFCRAEVANYIPPATVLTALRTFVWTGNERVGQGSRHDVARSHLLRLAYYCYVHERLTDPAVQLRLNTTLYGASTLRMQSTEFLSGQPDYMMLRVLKETCLKLLRANPYFVQQDLGRSALLRSAVRVWLSIIRCRQYTLAELRTIIPLFLSLLDGTQDVLDVRRHKDIRLSGELSRDSAARSRHEVKFESVPLMRVREMICQALSAAVHNAIVYAADEVVLFVYHACTQKHYAGGVVERHRPWLRRHASVEDTVALAVSDDLAVVPGPTRGAREGMRGSVAAAIPSAASTDASWSVRHAVSMPEARAAGGARGQQSPQRVTLPTAPTLEAPRAVTRSSAADGETRVVTTGWRRWLPHRVLSPQQIEAGASSAQDSERRRLLSEPVSYGALVSPTTLPSASHTGEQRRREDGGLWRRVPGFYRRGGGDGDKGGGGNAGAENATYATSSAGGREDGGGGSASATATDVEAYMEYNTERICDLFRPSQLVPLLFDLTRYKRNMLLLCAMRLLLQLCCVKRSMAQMVLRVNALPSAPLIRSFDRIHDVAVRLQLDYRAQNTYNEAWHKTVKLAVATLVDGVEHNSNSPANGAEASSATTPTGSPVSSKVLTLSTTTSASEATNASSTRPPSPPPPRPSTGTATQRTEELFASIYSSFALAADEEEAQRRERQGGGGGGGVGGVAVAERAEPPQRSVHERALALWSRTAAAARMLIYGNTIRNRRRLYGLSESSTASLNLVIRAEMMAHWQVHETLLLMLDKTAPSESTYFHLMKFFYLFTLSESNARLLKSSLRDFIAALDRSPRTHVLCLHLVLAILGTQSDIEPYLTTSLLTALVHRVNAEVSTTIPDSQFVELLSRHVFGKPSLSAVVRRRMMLILREHNVLRHVRQPRPSPSVVEIHFTSELINLLCNVCGTSRNALRIAQNILPAESICRIILERGEEDPLRPDRPYDEALFHTTTTTTAMSDAHNPPTAAASSSSSSQPQSYAVRGMTGFGLINPYIRALVALYLTTTSDNPDEQRRQRAKWTGSVLWWSIMRLFVRLQEEAVTAVVAGADTVVNRGLVNIHRHRVLFLTAIPTALAAFFINCYSDDFHTAATRAMVHDAMRDMCRSSARFGQRVLQHRTVLNPTVEEVVNYRRMLDVLRRCLEACRALHTTADGDDAGRDDDPLAQCRACETAMRDWLQQRERGTTMAGAGGSAVARGSGRSASSRDGRRHPFVPRSAAEHGAEVDEAVFDLLFGEEAASPKVHRSTTTTSAAAVEGGGGAVGRDTGLLLFNGFDHDRRIGAVQKVLRGILQGDTIVPGVTAGASRVALITNALLVRCVEDGCMCHAVARIIHAMRAQLFLPRAFVGLLNLFYNALDTALHHRHLLRLHAHNEDDDGGAGGVDRRGNASVTERVLRAREERDGHRPDWWAVTGLQPTTDCRVGPSRAARRGATGPRKNKKGEVEAEEWSGNSCWDDTERSLRSDGGAAADQPASRPRHQRSNFTSIDHTSLGYRLQSVFSDLGMMLEAVSFSAAEDDVVAYNAMRLGVALLEGGNRHVQRGLLAHFVSREEGFFQSIQFILRKNLTWVRQINAEHQYYLLKRGMLSEEARITAASANLQLIDAFAPRQTTQFVDAVRRGQAMTSSTMSLSSSPANAASLLPTGWARVRGRRQLRLIALIFRLLQLFCEGHLRAMQNYIRVQRDNLHSVNVIHETMIIMEELSSFITAANYTAVTHGFDLLTEVCQGPCRANQDALIAYNVCGMMRRVLAHLGESRGMSSLPVPHAYPDPANAVDAHAVERLRVSIGTTLLAIIEGRRDAEVYQRVLAQLPPQELGNELLRTPHTVFQHIVDDDGHVDAQAVATLFNWLVFFYSVEPYANSTQRVYIGDVLRYCRPLLRFVGSVEVNRDEGPERVYFRIPSVSDSLTKERKEELLRSVDRTSRASKLADFMHQADDLIFALEQSHAFRQRLRRWTYFEVGGWAAGVDEEGRDDDDDDGGGGYARLQGGRRRGRRLCAPLHHLYNSHIAPYLLSDDLDYYEWLSIAIAVIVNVNLILFAGSREGGGDFWRRDAFVLRLLGLVQTWLSAVLFYVDVVVAFPNRLYALYKSKERFARGGDEFNIDITEVYRGLRLGECVHSLLTWFAFQFRGVLLVMAILSWLWSPYFAAFNLMLLVYKITTLRTFIAAITMNGKQLLLSFLLGLIILYLFSIVGYLAFPADFDREGKSNSKTTVGHGGKAGARATRASAAAPHANCATLLQCFTYIVNGGLRAGGGVGDVMRQLSWGEPMMVPRLIYDMFFYALVTVVFLNIMFGIIVDTFGQMRDEKRERDVDMHTHCFICGLDSDTLEKNVTGGFAQHVAQEHNMWMYLYFMHHLRHKDPNDFTGQESYVYGKIQQNSLAFFPDQECLSLLEARQGARAADDNVSNSSNVDDDNDDDAAAAADAWGGAADVQGERDVGTRRQQRGLAAHAGLMESLVGDRALTTATAAARAAREDKPGTGHTAMEQGNMQLLLSALVQELAAAKEGVQGTLRDMAGDAQRLHSLLQALELRVHVAGGTHSGSVDGRSIVGGAAAEAVNVGPRGGGGTAGATGVETVSRASLGRRTSLVGVPTATVPLVATTTPSVVPTASIDAARAVQQLEQQVRKDHAERSRVQDDNSALRSQLQRQAQELEQLQRRLRELTGHDTPAAPPTAKDA